MSARPVRRRAAALVCALAVVAATFAATGIEQPAGASDVHTVSGFVVEKLPTGDQYGAEVYLFYYLINGELQEAARARTDDTGAYSLSVPDRTYYLSARPLDHGDFPGGGVDAEWYGDTPFQEAATPIVVDGADVALSDIALEPTHRVTGQVVDELGHPAKGAVVYTDAPGQVAPDPDFAGWTDGQGRFSLWAGEYAFALQVHPYEREFATEWFLDQWRSQDATPIRALTDTVLPPIVVGPGGRVEGTVTGSDGPPARHVGVVLTNTTTLEDEAAALTDVTGHYVLESVPPGSYRLTVDGGARSGNEWDYLDPEPVPVTLVDHTTTPLDVTLTRHPRPAVSGSVITGRVVDAAGRPVRGIAVSAMSTEDPTDDPAQMDRVAGDVTDPDGIYRIHPSSPSSAGQPVHIYLSDYHGERSWPIDQRYDLVSAFMPGVRHHQDATVVTIPSGTLTLPDTVLEEEGGIAGRVLLPDGSSPTPVRSAVVYAYDEEGQRADSAPVQPNGRYYLSTLRPGSYRIWFGGYYDLEHVGPFLPNWWSGGTDFASATPVDLSSGQTIVDVDAEVQPRDSTVTGRLVDPEGRPVAGVYVNTQEYPYDDVFYVSRPNTDRDGRFSIQLGGARQYKMGFGTNAERRFRPLWYGGGTTYATGGVLTVNEGQQYLDLGDIRVSPYPTISGRVTGPTGQRLSRVRVQPYLPDGTPVGTGVTTVGDGSYLLRLPAGGDYRLGFIPPGASVPTQWFHDGTTFAAARTVTLTEEQQLVGIDEQFLAPPPAAPPATAASPPGTSVTKVTATYKEKRRHRRSRAVLDAVVQVAGGGAAAGTVSVSDRGRVIAQLTLVNGRAKVIVKHPTSRVHTYVITYLGNPTTAGSSATVTVDTR